MIAGFGEPLPDRKTLRRRAHDWMRWIPGVVLLKVGQKGIISAPYFLLMELLDVRIRANFWVTAKIRSS
jgi:hypothetical protein